MKNKFTISKINVIRAILFALIIAVMAVIFALSAQNSAESSGTSGGVTELLLSLFGIGKENMSEAERDACIFPVEYIFRDLTAVTLPDFFSRLAHSGLEIYLKKINAELALGERVRLLDKEGFFALGEVREYPDGLAIKPIRQF